MNWEDVNPGDYPVFLVGAGFALAALQNKLPSTPNLIQDTATKYGADFPLIDALHKSAGTNTRLDAVWASIDILWKWIASEKQGASPNLAVPLNGPSLITAASQGYTSLPNSNPMKVLFQAQNKRTDKDAVLSIVLAVELKRMLALQYAQANIRLDSTLIPNTARLFDSVDNALLVSLNYDLALETLLDTLPNQTWRYAFQGLFERDFWANTQNAGHVVVKPHGSLNIWFDSDYTQNPEVHKVCFASPVERLATCDWKAVGYYGSNPYQEKRPCVIGYLPDALKDEMKTFEETAEASHDFAKWNLTHAGLSLHRATSVFIIGYSLPYADGWIWSRLNGLSNKTIPVYVASRRDSRSIATRLGTAGFTHASVLGNGDIC